MDAVLQLKEMGYETFTCAMAKDGPAADASDHFEIINILDENAIVEYIQKNKIDVVYSTGSDLAIPVACRISEKLNMPHFVTADVAYTCNNKDVMRKTLTPACKGNIPYYVVQSLSEVDIDKLSYPMIMKPSDSQGQRGIFLVNNAEEIKTNFEMAKKYSRKGNVIIEKYVNGPELSVNVYMVEGKTEFLAVSDRVTWPEYTGLIHKHIVPTRIMSEKSQALLLEIVEDACNRVGIKNGPAYFQIKVENEHPYIIEMTPRLDGCHMWNILNRATGVNLMKLTFEHLLNNNLSELDNYNGEVKPMELVFWCQKPNTIMNRDDLELPSDSLYHFYYYNTGDNIRPVNGRFDKIGYYIRNME
ncbi:MAG: ATP-grasp domain-containing protein [Ruminococcaceae bacterium]|nr:ATP-grasp domain-containing protein [Oscillospiraceae bacterium]